MKKSILYLSIIIASGIAITNIYTSIVDAASWGSEMPKSLETAREYYKAHNPGDFFRLFSPICQLLALVSLIAFWRRKNNIRSLLLSALLIYILSDAFTFIYFYPRNEIMFFNDTLDVENAKIAWQEWNSMNWVRTVIVGLGILCSSMALDRIYKTDLN
jgi:hypothetical protein